MPMPVSAALAMWGRAWLTGQAAFDDVIDVVTAGTGPHEVHGLTTAQAAHQSGGPDTNRAPWSDRTVSAEGPQRIGSALIAWRTGRADLRVVLPVAGDVRGVPGPRDFLDAALAAGEAVYGGGLGLVPERDGARRTPSVWRAFVVTDAAPDPLQISDAEHDLLAVMRETAALFTTAGVGGGAVPTAELSRARRASEDLRLPPGFPPRAAALLAQAERLHAMLAIAARDPQGGGTDRSGINLRADALRTLTGTVRRARLAGYNACPERGPRP